MKQKIIDKILHLSKKIDAHIVFELEPYKKKDIVCGYFCNDNDEHFWIFDHLFDGIVRIYVNDVNKRYKKNKINKIIELFEYFSNYEVLLNDETTKECRTCLYENMTIKELDVMTKEYSYETLIKELQRNNAHDIVRYFERIMSTKQ